MTQEGYVYLKLGGSLITDKRRAETARPDVLRRLAQEIAAARRARPAMRLIVGHGSGSFGHTVGQKYGTRADVRTVQEWYGFAAVADVAARLNRLVTAALLEAGAPAWSIQPSVALRCCDGRVLAGPAETVRLSLERGVLPVVYGDVALDEARGGVIVSTEEIFEWLAEHLPPSRMVLAGEVDGVYTADPQIDPTAARIPLITPDDLDAIAAGLGGSHGVDVTGGMAAKVAHALALVQRHHGMEVIVCSGLTPGAVFQALSGEAVAVGTRLCATQR